MGKSATKRRVRKIDVKQNLTRCPDCSYADGFHVRFARVGKSEKFHVQMLCPMCGEIFDMGIKVEASHGE